MDKEVKQRIEVNLEPIVKSFIEIYIKEKMTLADKVIAKNNTLPKIKKEIDEFCKEYNQKIEEVVNLLKYIISHKDGDTKTSCKEQSALNLEMLDILIQEKEDKSYGNY